MSLFITLEGGEGVGKSTNLAFVESYLRNRQLDVVTTREPGGTEFAEQIREMLLKPRTESVAPLSELFLIFAARNQHLQQLIKPALAEGHIILCDRFVDATYAYQGYGRNFDLQQIGILENMVTDGLKPDLTLLLDAPVEVGMARARERGELDRFEQEQNDFFEAVRKGYQRRVAEDPDRFIVINCEENLDSVQQQISRSLDDFFSAKSPL